MKRHFLLTAEKQKVLRVVLSVCALFSTVAFGLSESTGTGGSNAQQVRALGYEGQNVNIGFISLDNLRVSHEAFYEKDQNGLPTGSQHAFVHDIFGFGINATDHDTELAGIVVSNSGQSYPDQIGVAPKAILHNIRVSNSGSPLYSTDLVTALEELIVNQDCRVIVTGIALSIDGDGQSVWSKIYDYYAQTYDVLFANAAGNYNSSYPNVTTVNAFGDAYNGITTAGLINTGSTAVYDKVGSLSLPGRTTDGRQKPDVGAPSPYQTVPSAGSDTAWATVVGTTQGYTSWSVPHTAGVAALLLNYADTSSEANDGHSEVIRAVIVNSTFPNIISKSGIATTGLTWQADRGYGRIDAFRAYEILSSPKITPSSSTSNTRGWAYDAIAASQQDIYTIEGHKNERLLVTLTWNRKVVWTDHLGPGHGVMEDNELVPSLANLDLKIYDPDGVLISPASSTVDNLEKVDLLLTKTGNYEIRIVNQPISEYANYGLAFELLPPLVADFNTDYVVNDLDLMDFVTYWLNTGCDNPTLPCFDYNLGGNNTINLSDFTIFAEKWLSYDSRYYNP